jgi:hypothetical protein
MVGFGFPPALTHLYRFGVPAVTVVGPVRMGSSGSAVNKELYT